jgi:PncC family amidohydrolase
MKELEKLIAILKKRRLSLALAESCTAGFASYLLTKIAGSSKVFKGALVVYSLESKNKLFKIPKSLLIKDKGVSKKTALSLAKAVRKKFSASIGGSLVGFAGPTAKKGVKVGVIFVGIAFKNSSISKKIIFKGNRDTVRKKASFFLIKSLYEELK